MPQTPPSKAGTPSRDVDGSICANVGYFAGLALFTHHRPCRALRGEDEVVFHRKTIIIRETGSRPKSIFTSFLPRPLGMRRSFSNAHRRTSCEASADRQTRHFINLASLLLLQRECWGNRYCMGAKRHENQSEPKNPSLAASLPTPNVQKGKLEALALIRPVSSGRHPWKALPYRMRQIRQPIRASSETIFLTVAGFPGRSDL